MYPIQISHQPLHLLPVFFLMYRKVHRLKSPEFVPLVATCQANKPQFQMKVINSLEVIIHPALNSVGLQPEVNISTFSNMNVILVEHIIQAFIQVLQV